MLIELCFSNVKFDQNITFLVMKMRKIQVDVATLGVN